MRIHSPSTTLYTEDTGEWLDVHTDIEIQNSDSVHTDFGAFNGFGFSTDLFFKAETKGKNFFFARISNLGFIRWNNQSTEVKADSTFRFDGIDVSQVLNFTDTVRSTVDLDSSLVQPFLTHRKYQSYTLFLPAKVEFIYKRAFDDHFRAGAGANYIVNADYFPMMHFDGDYSWNRDLISLRISYGGYTTFGTALFYQHHFNHGYRLALGSQYINSLFHLNTATAEDVHISFGRNF